MQRVTVNPKNGRSEYVFVNLEALYPNTGYPGTEFSFEELMAGHRGWLNKIWNPEINHTQSDSRELEHKTDDSNLSSDALSGESPDSLVAVHDPVMLDENGLAKDLSREGRARKMKVKEINETQISKSQLPKFYYEAYRE
jgi:checkpoint serine/threonine-protein kinase